MGNTCKTCISNLICNNEIIINDKNNSIKVILEKKNEISKEQKEDYSREQKIKIDIKDIIDTSNEANSLIEKETIINNNNQKEKNNNEKNIYLNESNNFEEEKNNEKEIDFQNNQNNQLLKDYLLYCDKEEVYQSNFISNFDKESDLNSENNKNIVSQDIFLYNSSKNKNKKFEKEEKLLKSKDDNIQKDNQKITIIFYDEKENKKYPLKINLNNNEKFNLIIGKLYEKYPEFEDKPIKNFNFNKTKIKRSQLIEDLGLENNSEINIEFH